MHEVIEMKEYTKIQTVFNRDEQGTKKLIEGSFRNKAVEFLANNKWICTEKIDGTNIGIVWDGHKVSFQGRTEKAQIPAHLVNVLNEMFGNNQTEELFEQLFGEKNVILFGEGYGLKIQKGDSYLPDRCSFILFDVYIADSDIWLERENIEQIAKTFGIDVVPIVMVGTLYEAIEYVKGKPKSTIGTADMEGLVCKPEVDVLDRQGNRIIVKVKVVDF